MIYNLFWLTVGLFGMSLLLWNVIPELREKLRGSTSYIADIFMGLAGLIGFSIGAVQDSGLLDYLPDDYMFYVVLGGMVVSLIQRKQTKTPCTLTPQVG